jgi:hypothetical protein
LVNLFLVFILKVLKFGRFLKWIGVVKYRLKFALRRKPNNKDLELDL